jgi:outer membrane protein assembly factor BamB
VGDEDNVSLIFAPVQREYRLALGRAEKAIAESEYATAVEELTRILNGDDQNDYFLGGPGEPDSQTSLKTQALRLLGSLPPKGRNLYELKCGHEARKLLDDALEKGDLAALTEVARRYFHTQAGYEAVILLGRLQLDRGRPLVAALQFQRVAEVESAAATYDPELSLLLATSWLHAQQPDKAKETLLALKSRMPLSRVRIGADEVGLFSSDEQALAWLEKIVGQGGKARTLAATQWVMYRGNEMRNGISVASMPLLNFRWSLPTVGDPPDQQRVRSAIKTRLDKQETLVPALQPLVVNNYVIFRTPDRVVGTDLETGKRVWIFPWDDTPYEQMARTTGPTGRAPAVNTREQELYQRLFDDHAFGQLSSDGEQVFVIHDMGLAPGNGTINPNNVFGPRWRAQNPLSSRPFNKLVALSVPKQGAMCWEIGGESGSDEPALAGAFFLGPPLPLGGQLYVLAEFNGEIRLLCLSGRSGALEWQQTLAVMTEQQPITVDPLRRLAGATPSFANGLLICPTSGGGVVAVDPATRTLRWGYRYPRWDLSMAFAQPGFRVRRSREVEQEPTPAHWTDSSVTIADGCVVLTPPESDKLHCLDLLTGKTKWPPQPRGEMLFVGCVHDGKAVLVGRNVVKAVNLSSGDSAWQAVVDLGTETPTGRGYYSDHFYYLPVTSSQLLKIDLDKGEIVSRVKTEVTLGNLVCYEDDLVSHSGEMLTAFYLTEPLRKRVDELLAKNPADVWALTRKGEVLLQDGQAREAVDLLRKAYALKPQDEATRSMLARVMISLLREDYEQHADLTEEAVRLVADQPAEARELQRLRAMAMHKSGKLWEAFQAYLEIGRTPPADADMLEEVARDHQVRRDRWVAGRLAALFEMADETTREKMTAEIKVRRDEALTSADIQSLRDYVGRFGFHPLANLATLRLAQLLAAGPQPLEAELLVGELLDSPQPEVAGAATAILASLYEKAGQLDLAAAYYAELQGKYADVVCLDEQTGRKLAESAARSAELTRLLSRGDWPIGLSDVKVSATESIRAGIGFGETKYPVLISDFRGAAPRGLRAAYSSREQTIQVRNSLGRPIANVPLARGGSAAGTFYSGPSNYSTGRLNGHLLVVGIGGELVALSALSGNAATVQGPLWRHEVMPPDPTGRRYYPSQNRQLYNPLLGGNRSVYSDPQSQISLGPVSPRGVCFQRNRQLVCVDPITGKTLWERKLLEAGCEIFGDEERIVVVPPKSGDALILSPIDGEIVDRRKIDLPEQRWTTCGRNLLVFETSGPQYKLQLYDASNQGNGLWKTEVKRGTRGTIIDGEELALLEPGGKFTIVSLIDGREILSQQLKDLEALGENDLVSIVVLRSSTQYLLLANQNPTDADRSIGASAIPSGGSPGTVVHGQLVAFDRQTGATQWPAAAFIAQHGLAAEQPNESPVLFFVRNVNTRAGAGTTRNSTSLLAIDKRDGRMIYNDDGFISQAFQSDILADPLRNTVSITLSTYNRENRTLTVELTDKPVPPQPPAQTGSRSSLTAGELAGEVDRATAEAVQAMQREAQQGNNPGRVILPARNFRLPALPPGLPLPR